MTIQTVHQDLWGIGVIRLPSLDMPLLLSHRDIDRDTQWAGSVLQGMGVGEGSLVLIVGACSELGQITAYERAVLQLGGVNLGVEPGRFDAYRIEMYLRRFTCQAVLGVNSDCLAGLLEAGHDLKTVFGSARNVAAYPDAAAQLEAAGVPVWRQVNLGPTYAFESPCRDGARYDRAEWHVESQSGQLLLTARHRRGTPLVRLRTGVAGTVADKAGEQRLILS